MKRNIFNAYIFSLLIVCGSCKKLVDIPQPVSSVTSQKVFGTDARAMAAVTGIYSYLSVGSTQGFDISFGNGKLTLSEGAAADELVDFGNSVPQFYTNQILSNNAFVSNVWSTAYYSIYMANAAIEGLQASTTLTPSVKNQLIGEAKFIRAFCHFYLVNIYGDVPLVTTSVWTDINTMSRTPVVKVYEQVVQDLKDSQGLMGKDYATSGGEHIRANYWAATALLARVYLYQGDWKDADVQSTAVISSGKFSLTDLNSVFLKNSDESILQLQTANAGFYATEEGNTFIPRLLTSSFPQAVVDSHPGVFTPSYYLTPQLVNDFEAGDNRLTSYVDTTGPILGVKYYYPYKYKVKVGSSGNISEYYTLLRLGEQYLIRAEARANENTDLPGAIGDLDIIRNRAGLAPLSNSLSQAEVLAAVAHERRIELLAEWGHRWFDLKRTGQAQTVLGAVKQGFSANALIWPIPLSELSRDPNLKQNPGY